MTRLALLAFLIACDQGRSRANDPPPAPPRTGIVLDPEGPPSPAPEIIAVPTGAPVDAAVPDHPPDTRKETPTPKRDKIGSIPGNGEPAPSEGRTGGTTAVDKGAPPAPPTPPANADPHPLSDSMRELSKNGAYHLQAEEGTLAITSTATGTAQIKLTPAAGWHIATDYNIKLWLEAPTGVALPKTYFTAGGKKSSKGDASALSEQVLAFDVSVAGGSDVTGVLAFGICEKDSCHPKTQPITIHATGK